MAGVNDLYSALSIILSVRGFISNGAPDKIKLRTLMRLKLLYDSLVCVFWSLLTSWTAAYWAGRKAHAEPVRAP